MTQDAEPILWHVPMSRTTPVLWLLGEIGSPFRVRAADSEEAGAPRTPALQIGDILFHEPGAMIELLCESRAPDLWRAPGTEGRIGWLDWLHFAATLGGQVDAAAAGPAVAAGDRPEAEGALAGALGLMSARLAGQDWLMAGGFSGVDCAVGWHAWRAQRLVQMDPALAAYAARCAGRPAFAAATAPGGPGA